jgi:hypothetical protein
LLVPSRVSTGSSAYAGERSGERGARRRAPLLGNALLEPVAADELPLRVAEDLAALAVDQCNAAVAVQREQHDLGEIEVALGPVTLAPQRVGGRLARRDVVDEADEARRARARDLADRQRGGKQAAVAAQRDDLAADADDARVAGLQVRAQVGVVLGTVRVGHQHRDVAAEDLGGTVAEQPLGRAAEGLDAA